MKSFNEGFYTEDFDQEMLDFIESNHTVDHYVNGWSNLDLCLCYSEWDKDFYLKYSNSTVNKLTKEEFKRKIGMPTGENTTESETIQEQATFGKKDLVDGMFVKCRNGKLHVVIGMCAHNNNGWMDLENEFTEDLLETSDITNLDIVEVFLKAKNFPLAQYLKGAGLQSIWKRTPPKSEKVIKLEERISTMQDNLLALKEQLEEELTL